MQPIQTERLMLRPFAPSDEEAAYAFFSDPSVMRFSLNGPHASRKPTEDFIVANVNRQQRLGYSIWAVVETESGAVVGMCGLAEFGHGVDGTELAYRLRKDRWGRGYATEAGRGAVEFAFSRAKLDRLIGAVEPANVASVQVLEKCGFVRAGRRVIAGKDAFVYEQSRNDWLQRQIRSRP